MSQNKRIQFIGTRFAGRPFVGILALLAISILSARPASAQTETETDPLRKVNSAVEALIAKVGPSVVQILVTGYGTLDDDSQSGSGVVIGRQRAIGSGFIIDSSGYIVTNAHVVKGAQRVQIVLARPNGDMSPINSLTYRSATLPARIIGVANDVDLAVLKIDAQNLPPLPVAKFTDLRQGELVFAFGSPQGFRNSVSMGVISSTARQTDPDSPMIYIQTDAPINPGNSGGPLVNVNGEVVGVNTFILTSSGGNEGLGFAIPSAIISVVYGQLRLFGHLHHGEIGAEVQSITPTLASALKLARDSGVVISDVRPGSPADSAGLRVQDVVISMDGQPVENVPYFGLHLVLHETGARVHLDVLRGTKKLPFDVTVVEKPLEIDQLASLADPEKSLIRPLGVLGVELNDKIAAEVPDLRDPYGVMVVARSAESTGEVPLTAGDVIRSINGQKVSTLEGLRNSLNAIKPGDPVALQIQREDRLMFLAFTLD
ncbi:MAG: trypsin-like peptidase domain-containing protein [Candidatus Acidiferrales bacterium]